MMTSAFRRRGGPSSTSPFDGYHFQTSMEIASSISWTSLTGAGGALEPYTTSASALLAVAEVKGLVTCTGSRPAGGDHPPATPAEGFGLTVSEAMFKRRPVIGSAVGGIADQIVDGESGVLLPAPSELSAFTATLADLLADPERLAAMGERARERVVDRFLPDAQLARWSAVVSTVLG
jgi:hypothetical protein